MSSMIDLALWDRNMAPVAPLSSYEHCELTLRHNAIGQAVVRLSASDWRAKHMIARGARLTADLDGRRWSGRLLSATAKGPAPSATWEATFEGDCAVLWGMRAFPDPEHDHTDQTAAHECVVTGPVETVIKQLVARNARRFTIPPIVCAADQQRGPTVTVKARMETIGELVADLATEHGIGISVTQDDAMRQLVVDCYAVRDHPYALSDIGGTVTDWTITQEAPSVTSVYVASGADAVTFLRAESVWDQDWAWGRQIEAYTETSATSQDELIAAAKEAIDAGSPKWGVSASLTAGPTFQFGRNVWLGDRVSVELAGEQGMVTDRLREVVVTSDMGLDRDGYPVFSVSPSIGERADGTYDIYSKVARIAQRQSRG